MTKTLQVVIIDDEPNAIEVLQAMINNFIEGVCVVGTAHNALVGLKIIHANEPDFILLDVDMPGGSGFDLIEALGKNNLPIIFTTASNQHAIKALKIKATDYLLKPIDIDELSEAISKVKVQILNQPIKTSERLALPIQGGLQFVAKSDIIYLNNEGNYTTFYVKPNLKYLISKNIGYFDEQLVLPMFYKCHQSSIINLQEVVQFNRIDGTHVIMSNGERVDVSRSKKEELFALLNG